MTRRPEVDTGHGHSPAALEWRGAHRNSILSPWLLSLLRPHVVLQAQPVGYPRVGFFRLDHPASQMLDDTGTSRLPPNLADMQEAAVAIDITDGVDAIAGLRAKFLINCLVANGSALQ